MLLNGQIGNRHEVGAIIIHALHIKETEVQRGYITPVVSICEART